MKRLTLTFDNGPTLGVTDRVLDILAKHDVRTTFMVLGKKIACDEGQALLADIASAGHWIGNHTYTHWIALGDKLEPGYATSEIQRTQDLIGAYAHPDRLFRPFGNSGRLGPHLLSEEAVALLARDGYSCLLWNSIPRDWVEGDDWVSNAAEQVRNHDWAVTVLHDVPGAAVERLDEFLSLMKDADVRLEQAIPDSVMPIRRGIVVSLPDGYVAERARSASPPTGPIDR